MEPERLLPLTPLTLHILIALTHGAAHGYAVGAAIEEASGGHLRPTTGSLYQALKRLRDEGLLRAAPPPAGDRSAGPPRLFFELTELGREVARLEAIRLDRLLDAARDTGLLTPARSRTGR